MRLPINPKPMYPIPAPMFVALSPKFAHNSWHSQYKSNVTNISPSLPFAPFCFPPPKTLALPKMFQVQVYKCLGMLWETLGMASDCAPLVLVTWKVVWVWKMTRLKNVVPMWGPRADWGQMGGKICSSTRALTDWLTDPPTHINNYEQT
jgi:hypothetical protein